MSAPHHRPPLLLPAPADWLLDPSDPPVRLRALRELFDLRDDAAEVKDARAAVLETPRVKAVLEAQKGDGSWGDLAKEDGPGGTAWNLSWLLLMGVPARDPRVVAGMRALLQARHVRESEHHPELPAGAWTFSKDPSDVASCVSGDDLSLALTILGPVEENRRSVLWLLAHQRHDGGWLHCHRWGLRAKMRGLVGKGRYEWPEESDPSVRSCRFGTFRAMRGLATLPEELRDELVRKALTRGAEYFLSRGVTGSLDHPDVDLVPHVKAFNPGLQVLGTPVRQNADMLAIARLLVDLGYGADARLARTLDRIRKAQGPEGKWSAETNAPGHLGADETPAGRPSKWVTIDALSLLRRVARSHGYELDLGVRR